MLNRIISLILVSLLCYVTLCAQQTISPVEYIKNQGQWDGDFLYKGITTRGDIYLKNNSFKLVLSDANNSTNLNDYMHGHLDGALTLKYHAYEMLFVGANENPLVSSAKLQNNYYNYFLGSNPDKWKGKIHPALNVNYTNLYPNIDAHVYSSYGNIKYDLIVKSGADPKSIKIKYDGVSAIQLKKKTLQIKTSLGDNVEQAPEAYQIINDERVSVPCDYVINEDKTISFSLGKNYNANYDLVIDPVVIFCSFSGSTADNWGWTATPGVNGEFFAGGICNNTGYPVTNGAFQSTFAGGSATTGSNFPCDISITKFFSNGSNIHYATYIGGSNNDQPHSIIADAQGKLYITGVTYSTNFPVKTNAFDASQNGGADMYVAVLSAGGDSMLACTYVGGSADDGVNISPNFTTFGTTKRHYGDNARSEIIIDANKNIYVAANSVSTNFPTSATVPGSANSIQTAKSGLQDAVVFQLNPACTNLLWSTYLGGSNNDAAFVLAIDKTNPLWLYVAGGTASSNFPHTTPGSLNPTFQGGTVDGFICKFNTANKALIRGTFIGTSAYDQVYGITTDHNNNVHIMGQSLGPYPIVGTTQSFPANSAQFSAKIDSSLSTHINSAVFGTGNTTTTNIAPNAFLVDLCGNIYISGWGGDLGVGNPGNTSGMQVTANALKPTTDGDDFYFIVWDSNYNQVLYASFFGQNNFVGATDGGEHVDGGTSRFDENGVIYQAICANCGNGVKPTFPTTPGSFSPNNLSTNCNLAAYKLDFQLVGADAKALVTPNDSGCAPFVVNFGNLSTNAVSYIWNFGDGTPTSPTSTPIHTYTNAGTYTVTLTAINPNGCLGNNDTAQLIIVVKNDSVKADFTALKIDTCNPYTVKVTNNSIKTGGPFSPNVKWLWSWGDGSTSSTLQNPPNHAYANPGIYTITLTATDSSACVPVSSKTVVVNYNTGVVGAAYTLPDTACPPFTHNFVNTGVNPITYFWDFGDGNTSTSANPTHTYANAGVFITKLVVSNPASCNKKDSLIKKIVVAPKLSAAFTYVKTDTCDPYTIALTNNSVLNTVIPGALTWTRQVWNWGDGTPDFIGGNPGSHTYTTPGVYNVSLTIYDSTSCNSPQSLIVPITFIDNRVRAKFEIPDTICVPYTHNFLNLSTNANTYEWDFGGGNTSTSSTPTFTFNNVGTFTVTLTVRNPTSCNKVDNSQMVVTGVPSPTVNFNYAPDPPAPNKPVNFNNLSVGATQYYWDFGDGKTSTETNPTHLYAVNGTLDVCLTAFNEYGCSNKACKLIQPKVNFLVDFPTGFSPNGDGVNDVAEVKGYGIKSIDLKIYNRWGELVFTSTELGATWNGKYKGKLQEVDAYAYVLNATFTDGSITTKKGSLNLIQ